jgi:hypothetical protein
MRRSAIWLGLVILSAGAACSKDSTTVDLDAIDSRELATVRTSLDSALKNDSNYQTLRVFVFQFIDRATRVANASGDTTRLVGIQLDVNATKAATPVVAQMTAILAWRGYRPATRTVDSVAFLIGAGIAPPLNDSLRTRFSPDTAGTGTGFVIHQAPDSIVTAWLARQGALHVTAASFGNGQSQSGGGLTLTIYKGTLTGDYHVTAKLVPDSSTTVSTQASFPTAIRALKMRITGALP